LHQSIFPKLHYKHEIYSDECLFMHSEKFIQAQIELLDNNYDYINETENKILIKIENKGITV
jgi:hypothetical protein